MAVTRVESQVTWSSANTVTITAGSTSTSDVFTPNAGTLRIFLQAKGTNLGGTTVVNDVINVWALTEIGDIDATGGDDYTTSGKRHRLHVMRLICNASGGGETPAVSTLVELPLASSYKFQAKNFGPTNSITVGIRALEIIGS